MIDSRSLTELHPAVRRAAEELKRRMAAAGYDVLVTSTYRDFERQDVLYAQGRTAPGAIVTNCRGGESIHNYGLAFDICKNVKGQEYSDAAFFALAGKTGMEMGLVWGGSWAGFVDKPHFEYTGGMTLSRLKRGEMPPEGVLLKWEHEAGLIKEETEMVDKVTVMIDGKETELERIFKDGVNYIKLRELERFGFKVVYDEARKMPVLETKQALSE